MTPTPPATDRRRGSLSYLLPPALLALLLLGLTTLVSLHASRRYSLDTRWVAHTHQVLQDLAMLKADIGETNLCQREYLITGGSLSRARYRAARDSVRSDLQTLRRLTSDNPAQQARLNALDGVLDRHLSELDSGVSLYAAGRAETAYALAAVTRRDAPAWLVGEITAEEDRLLARRAAAAETAGRVSQTLVLCGAALVLLLLLLGAALAVQSVRDGKRAENVLLAVQADLRNNVQALGESEAQFRSAIAAMQEGLLVHGPDGVILLCNSRAEQIFGVPSGTLVGSDTLRGDWCVFREDGTEFPREEFPGRLALRSGQTVPPISLGLRSLDGGWRWLQVSAAPLFHTGAERPHAVVITFSDITERRAAEAALRETEERYRGIYENFTEGIFQSIPGGRFLSVNPAFAWMIGYETPEDLLAEITDIGAQLYHRQEDRDAVLGALEDVGEIRRFETPFRRRDGSVVWVSMNVHRAVDAAGRVFLEGSIHDITERRATEQRLLDYNEVLEFQKGEMEKANDELERVNARLEALATQDGLTGLKNHRAFQDRLAEEVARARRYGTPLALVMLDVDHFKLYNDTFGHPAGDEVLLGVAETLREAVRESDYAARYGGEEFVLILPQTDAEGAARIAERCRAALEGAVWERRPITASFGVALLLPAHRDGAELLADADQLLYEAKARGRNQVAVPASAHGDAAASGGASGSAAGRQMPEAAPSSRL